MAWIEGIQKRPNKIDVEKDWQRQFDLKGFLEEDKAKAELYKYFRNNLSVAAEVLMGVKLFPYQHIVCKANMESDYALDILSRGTGKSYLAGVFIGLHALFNQGVKIGILSSTFRQSRQVFQYLEDISEGKDAKLFKDCILKIEHKNDEWLMRIGKSIIRALPLNNGDKLRGFRFNCIIVDELLLMPEKIINEVIIPFLGTVQNPQDRAELREAEDFLIQSGQMAESERYVWPNNKLIGLSSASYQFEYLYKLYKIYEASILGTSIDADKSDEISKKFSKISDVTRSIVHLSYEAIPQDIFDQNLLRQAMSQLSESQFAREFRSVFTDDSSGYFKMSKMISCTIPDGESPNIEVQGDAKDKYLISFDPSWSESDASDDFAIHVFKLNDDKRTGTLVHSYAVHGGNLKQHIVYFLYLLQNFNVVMIWGDYNGGVQFVSGCNESKEFKDRGIKLGVMTEEFDDQADYPSCLSRGKNEYNVSNRHYVCLRKPTGDWIRQANELLQANIDHARIAFGSRCVNASYEEQKEKDIPIDEITFDSKGAETKETGLAKKIDFLDVLHQNISLTKAETALIQVSSSAGGSQTFDLPENIKRQTGPNRTRKDSYSALVLGNWGIKVYYDMMNHKGIVNSDWTPSFV